MNEIFCSKKARHKEKSSTFAPAFRKSGKVDSVAQQVEHNTFNVGVLGSSPSRVTQKKLNLIDLLSVRFSFFCVLWQTDGVLIA